MDRTLHSARGHKVLAATVASAIAISGLALSGSAGTAYALGGYQDDSTAIVWGINSQDDRSGYGSYNFTVTGGKDASGYAITDPGNNPPVESDLYNQASIWRSLSADDRKKLAVAGWVGLQMEQGRDLAPVAESIYDVANTTAGRDVFGGVPIVITERDIMSAAVAGLILSVNDEDFDPTTLGLAQPTYQALLRTAQLTVDDTDNTFRIRSSANTAKPDVFVPSDSVLSAPVAAGVTLSQGSDPAPTSTPTTSDETTVSTPVTETPTTSTTTTTDVVEDIQLKTSAGLSNSTIYDSDVIEGLQGENVKVKDMITFSGLTPGDEYRIVGQIQVKDANGQAVFTGNEGERTFTPDTSSGRIDVEIPISRMIDGLLETEQGQGIDIVVFETLYNADGEEVATHHLIDDNAQTVTIEFDQYAEHNIDRFGDDNTAPTTAPTTNPNAPTTGTTGTTTPTTSPSHVVYDPNGGSTLDGSLRTKQNTREYENCEDAIANGASNIRQGEPGYSASLDRDGDGIACERDETNANAPSPEEQPRQTINDVPSGALNSTGDTLFTR